MIEDVMQQIKNSEGVDFYIFKPVFRFASKEKAIKFYEKFIKFLDEDFEVEDVH